jgi:hypothetical protein
MLRTEALVRVFAVFTGWKGRWLRDLSYSAKTLANAQTVDCSADRQPASRGRERPKPEHHQHHARRHHETSHRLASGNCEPEEQASCLEASTADFGALPAFSEPMRFVENPHYCNCVGIQHQLNIYVGAVRSV